jgi:hypothetical protein
MRGENSTSPLGGSGKKGAKVGPLNSRRHERREVLALSLVSGRARRVLTKEKGLYPLCDLGYHEIGEEDLGATTRELARLRDAKKGHVD